MALTPDERAGMTAYLERFEHEAHQGLAASIRETPRGEAGALDAINAMLVALALDPASERSATELRKLADLAARQAPRIVVATNCLAWIRALLAADAELRDNATGSSHGS